MKRISLIALGILIAAGCGGDKQDSLEGINSITFLQRTARGGIGDIFQYQSYAPGARIVQLTPPTADGDLTVVCCEQFPDFATADISWYDVSFDAREIVFSARLDATDSYSLYVYTIETDEVAPLPINPSYDYVSPIFLPGNKIMFMTNNNVEQGTLQFLDEYERRLTLQVGIINRDGSNEELGPRNLSHRIFPTLLSDGRVLITQWDHLARANEGNLLVGNPDMTRFVEAFGKESTGLTNSYLKTREISPGRVIAIGTARDRTLQSGTLLDIRFGETYSEDDEFRADRNMSEATASYNNLTPDVPRGLDPSSQTVGRYHDAEPIDAKEFPTLLVSWAPGPVEDGTLEAAGLYADFGIFLYDSGRSSRRPIYNDSQYWDVLPRVLAPRDAPPAIDASGRHNFQNGTTLVAATNVFDTSVDRVRDGLYDENGNPRKDDVYGVRLIEGYSSETPGIERDFGLTPHEGAARLGDVPVQADGSWAALIPANIPVRNQVIDNFGMAMASETVWISGRNGESMVCGGCHESRTGTTVPDPGVTDAFAVGPVELQVGVARENRKERNDYTIADAIGVPWDKALQPIFNAKCIGCHDGTDNGNNPSQIIRDADGNIVLQRFFDLREEGADVVIGDEVVSGYSQSYVTLMGPNVFQDLENGQDLTFEGSQYTVIGSARNSELIRQLNPPRIYPTVDETLKAFPELPRHGDDQGFTLTPDEYYMFILMADMGGQFYSRENAELVD